MTDPAAFPVPDELRTPRLWLRRPDPADAEALVAAVSGSRPELRRWMHWAQAPMTLEDSRENLRKAAEKFDARETLRYHVWNAAGTVLIGSSGYHALDWRVPKGEIGYWIATPHTGQGYAREVVQALTDLALDTLGYRLDAHLVNDDVDAQDHSKLRDTLVYSRVR